MAKAKKNDELSNLEKFLALAAVFVVMVIVIAVTGSMINSDSEDNASDGVCDAAHSINPCPEPLPDSSEELDNLPDASPHDGSDNCGGYSCRQLEQEAEKELDDLDQWAEQQINESYAE